MIRIVAGLLVLSTVAGCTVIRDPKPEECVVETFTVAEVAEGTSHDVEIHPRNGAFRYVNRGLERGPGLETWQRWLEGETVTLHVVRGSRHVARITRADGTVVFDEFGPETTFGPVRSRG